MDFPGHIRFGSASLFPSLETLFPQPSSPSITMMIHWILFLKNRELLTNAVMIPNTVSPIAKYCSIKPRIEGSLISSVWGLFRHIDNVPKPGDYDDDDGDDDDHRQLFSRFRWMHE